MSKKKRALVPGGLILIVVLMAVYINNHSVAVLSPSGPIGQQERNLILLAVGLSLIVVIPVYIMLISFAWRYRASNKKARYDPKFVGNRRIESIWWGVPLTIIVILGIATWRSSNSLDPFRPITSDKKTLTIQVVALQWKWLFIYPQQNIASVNLADFPTNTPVDFEITSDAPMNSFWIPKLGGQIYAMSGMATHLHLLATSVGDYHGLSANISGEGFAGMDFTARASNQSDFNEWVSRVQKVGKALSNTAYTGLVKPSKDNPNTYYSSVRAGLFDSIIAKYNVPSPNILGGNS